RPAAAFGALVDLLQHAQQLPDTAHEQPLLVDFDPGPGGGGEHDVIAGLDGHLHADMVPPVEAGADSQDDPLLGWRFVGAGRHEQSGAPDPIRVELLDNYAIE